MSAKPTSSTIGAFLPLRARDIDRAALLLRSLDCFPHPLRVLRIACPTHDLPAVAALAARHPRLPVAVATDAELLGPALTWLGGISNRWVRDGRQMLLKLYAAAFGEDPWLLTLDADVVLTRPLFAGDLVRDGKAPLVTFAPVKHPMWYRAAAHLLRLPVTSREMGVTPAILHRDAAREVLERLDRSVPGSAGIRLFLTAHRWTEYSLYYTCVAGLDRAHDLHRPVRYEDWFGPSVWHADDWPAWRFPSFREQPAGPPFSVVQSATKIPIESILERARRVLPSF